MHCPDPDLPLPGLRDGPADDPGVGENTARYSDLRHTRIKMCGITRLCDGLCAARLGVDAIGFVFVPASRRYIDPVAAGQIAARLPPFMVRVGLFLNAEAAFVHDAMGVIPSLVPQFHGSESAAWCEAFGRPYLKALGVADGLPTPAALAAYAGAQAFLFDSHSPGELGGTGQVFDWDQLGGSVPRRLILAGGLKPANVASAIQRVRPYAVDVSSGVEQAPGVKDPGRMREFVSVVRAADSAANQQIQASQSGAAVSREQT